MSGFVSKKRLSDLFPASLASQNILIRNENLSILHITLYRLSGPVERGEDYLIKLLSNVRSLKLQTLVLELHAPIAVPDIINWAALSSVLAHPRFSHTRVIVVASWMYRPESEEPVREGLQEIWARGNLTVCLSLPITSPCCSTVGQALVLRAPASLSKFGSQAVHRPS